MKNTSLLSTSFTEFGWLVRNKWQSYGWFVLFHGLLLAVLLGVSFYLLKDVVYYFVDLFQTMQMGSEPTPPPTSLFAALWLLPLFVLFSFLAMYLSFAFYRSIDDDRGSQALVDFLSRGRPFWYSFFSYIALSFFYFFYSLFFGLLQVLILLAMGGVEALQETAVQTPVQEVVMSIYSLLYFILTAYLMIPFIFSFYRVILLSEGPIVAFKNSWLLVKGKWWRTFGTMVVWFLIFGSIGAAVFFGIGVGAMALLLPLGFSQDFFSQTNAPEVIQQVISTLWSPGFIGLGLLFSFILLLLGMAITYSMFSVYRSLRKVS